MILCPSEQASISVFHLTCQPVSYKNAGLFSVDRLLIGDPFPVDAVTDFGLVLSADVVHLGVHSFSLLSLRFQQCSVPHSCCT